MRRDRVALVSGCIFIVLGVLFLLEQLGLIDVRSSLVLPIVLVAVGIAMLVGRGDDRPVDDDTPPPQQPPPAEQ